MTIMTLVLDSPIRISSPSDITMQAHSALEDKVQVVVQQLQQHRNSRPETPRYNERYAKISNCGRRNCLPTLARVGSVPWGSHKFPKPPLGADQ